MSTDCRQDRTTTEVQCLGCGTVRVAPGRVKEHRTVRCAGCGKLTRHRVTTREGADPCESMNAFHNRDLHRLMWLESVYQDFGIDVRYDVNAGAMVGGEPVLYQTIHRRTSETGHVWGVEVSGAATVVGKVHALRAALGVIVSERLDYADNDDFSSWMHPSREPYRDFLPAVRR